MQPSATEFPVNIPLTMQQSAFLKQQMESGYWIADQVFPRIPVQRKTANYNTWDVDFWLRAEAQRRAPGTESAGGGFTGRQAPLYNCYVTAFHSDLPEQVEKEAIANGQRDPRGRKVQFVSRQLLLRRELDFADAYMTTGVWGTDMTGVASAPTGNQFIYFDDNASSPIDVFGELIEQMNDDTGLVPNTLVITRRIRRALRRNAQFLAEARAIAPKTGESMPTEALLRELLEVDRVITARAVYNAGAEGKTKDIRPIFGNGMLLAYVDPQAQVSQSGDIDAFSAGYIFPWQGFMDGDAGFDGNAVKEIPMPLIESVRIEGQMAYDMRITAPLLGVYFNGVLAP